MPNPEHHLKLVIGELVLKLAMQAAEIEALQQAAPKDTPKEAK
jgi:hypothetical protein